MMPHQMRLLDYGSGEAIVESMQVFQEVVVCNWQEQMEFLTSRSSGGRGEIPAHVRREVLGSWSPACSRSWQWALVELEECPMGRRIPRVIARTSTPTRRSVAKTEAAAALGGAVL